MSKQKKYHYIYRTTCKITGKFYVGMHSTDNLEDGYLGSGKILGYSRNKYGDENHAKEIVEYCSSRNELKRREKEIVNEDLLADPLNINLKYGGEGGWEKINELGLNRITKNHPSFKPWFANKLKSDADFRNYISSRISKRLMEEYANGCRFVGGCFKDNSEIIKKAWTTEAKEKRKKTNEERKFQQGKNNSNFGVKRIGIYKNEQIKRVLPDEIDLFLNAGWLLGFKKPAVKIPKPRAKPNPEKNWTKVQCLKCKIEFLASQRDIRRGRKFCSISCANKFTK